MEVLLILLEDLVVLVVVVDMDQLQELEVGLEHLDKEMQVEMELQIIQQWLKVAVVVVPEVLVRHLPLSRHQYIMVEMVDLAYKYHPFLEIQHLR
jgi:hypothetical protein